LSKYFGRLGDSDDIIISNLNDMIEKALANDLVVIQNRLELYGVVKHLILKQNEKQIVVEFPLESKSNNQVEEIKQLLIGDSFLEFRIVKNPSLTFKVMSKIDSVLAMDLKNDSDLSQAKDEGIAEMTEEEFLTKHPFFTLVLLDPQRRTADAYIKEENTDQIKKIMSRIDVMKVIPENEEFVFSAKPFFSKMGRNIIYYFLLINMPNYQEKLFQKLKLELNQILLLLWLLLK
jgi:hypothetical protein